MVVVAEQALLAAFFQMEQLTLTASTSPVVAAATAAAVLIAAAVAAWGLLRPTASSSGKVVPRVQHGLPFFGQMFIMLKGSPWDTMARWALEYGTLYKLHLFGKDSYVVSDPALLRVFLNSKLSNFKKDVEWTYKPFLVILGNGLVTADGASWRKQRTLLSHHLRIDILEEIPRITFGAIDRFRVKLEQAKRDGRAVEMAEEFRHLTLQVVSEAILSLSAQESDDTFAHMYLPIGTSNVSSPCFFVALPQHMFGSPPLSWQWRKGICGRGTRNACTCRHRRGSATAPRSSVSTTTCPA